MKRALLFGLVSPAVSVGILFVASLWPGGIKDPGLAIPFLFALQIIPFVLWGAIQIATSLLNAYQTPDSDLATLAAIAISFCTVFVTSKLIFSIGEKIVLRRPFRRSSSMLSLLVASIFWSCASMPIMALLSKIAGESFGVYSLRLQLASLLLFPVLVAPFSGLFGLPLLLLYLKRPTTPRPVLIVGAVITMTACCAFSLYYNHYPEVGR